MSSYRNSRVPLFCRNKVVSVCLYIRSRSLSSRVPICSCLIDPYLYISERTQSAQTARSSPCLRLPSPIAPSQALPSPIQILDFPHRLCHLRFSLCNHDCRYHCLPWQGTLLLWTISYHPLWLTSSFSSEIVWNSSLDSALA